MIGAIKRVVPLSTLWDPVGCVYMFDRYDPSTDAIELSYNIAQGCEGIGFALTTVDCDKKLINGMHHNEAGVVS